MITGEDLKTFKKIEAYILGKLSESEVDELWVEFLKTPEWYELFEIELLLTHLAQHG